MATIGNSFVNLIDLYRSMGPQGEIDASVIEVLHRLSPTVKDAIATECNMGTTHKHTIRTGLPSVTWGRLYQGIPQSKSTKAQVEDTTGFVEGLSTIDERLLDISPNPAATRLSEAEGFLEAMVQEVETGIFYSDVASTPEKFRGLAARYNVSGGSGAGNQIVKAGGAGADNTSIWFVTWGESQTTLLFPKGTRAGLQRQDMGRQRVLDGDNNAYYAMEEQFRWHVGLAVRDWRYNVRIANIDVSEAQAGNVDLYRFMRQAFYKLQGRRATKMDDPNAAKNGRTVIYMNRDMLEALDALATNDGAGDNFVRLTPMQLEGQEVMSYRGIPIRETDALVNNEALVA
ncbi:hypothetical protein FHS96_000138 [Sphingomonas zeicaulis]|uniref:major capsid protein n=1 Tax=Sphingomonas zeicaulis TaxID=1632740 RepID=UPI003D1929D9